MGVPRFEVLAGVVDGVNTTFTAPTSYVSGSTAVFLNGQLKRRDLDDGWVELSPSAGTVDLQQAPLVGDVVQVFYTDNSSSGTEAVVSPIHGKVVATEGLRGSLLSVRRKAVLQEQSLVRGGIRASAGLGAAITALRLTGQVREC